MVFTWSLSESKSPQVSRIFLSILAYINNAVVWTVSARPVISKSSSPCTNPLETVQRAPIAIVTFPCFFFFNSLARFWYLSLFSHSFNFTLWPTGTAKSTILQVLSFLLIIIRSGRLTEIRWSVCISKSPRSFCVSFFRTDSVLCIDHSFVWSNFNFLHYSLRITLPTQLCLVLYSFCANLLHWLTMWLIVSSLSPRNLHLLFYYVLSILALIWFVFMALFCADIRRDSVSLLRFNFLSSVHVFLCEIKTSIRLFFFLLLFSGYCRSADSRVVSIVSVGCYQSSSALFYVVFKSLYRWVSTVFNAGKSSSSLSSVNVMSEMQSLLYGH